MKNGEIPAISGRVICTSSKRLPPNGLKLSRARAFAGVGWSAGLGDRVRFLPRHEEKVGDPRQIPQALGFP
jgi:hypothetical protein